MGPEIQCQRLRWGFMLGARMKQGNVSKELPIPHRASGSSWRAGREALDFWNRPGFHGGKGAHCAASLSTIAKQGRQAGEEVGTQAVQQYQRTAV